MRETNFVEVQKYLSFFDLNREPAVEHLANRTKFSKMPNLGSKKRKYRVLTMQERLDIIKLYNQKKLSVEQICQKYKVSRDTVSRII